MPETPGVDYAWTHPGGAALARAGYSFACRYSSNDPSKDITRDEAADLAAHGVWTVVVRETTANRARAGCAAGVADAKVAVVRAAAAGMPATRPLYFAIDYNAPASDEAAIAEYFRGVASVIGLARTGAYGGYEQLSRLKSAGLATWWWQTAAWSEGRLLPGRHIYQYAKTVTINGVSCDVNTALVADFGQWMPGKTPQEDDMPLTDADRKAIAAEVVAELTAPAARDALAGAVLYWLARAFDPTIALPTGAGAPGAAAQTAALRTALAKHAAGTGVTDAQLSTLADRMVAALVNQAKA